MYFEAEDNPTGRQTELVKIFTAERQKKTTIKVNGGNQVNGLTQKP